MQLHQRLLITARAQWTLRPPDRGDQKKKLVQPDNRFHQQHLRSCRARKIFAVRLILWVSSSHDLLPRGHFLVVQGVAIPYTCRPEPTNFSLITLLLVINHALSGWAKNSSKCWWGQCLLVMRAILHPLKVSCRAQRHFGFLIDTQRILGSLWYRTAMENKRHW